jgi:hypothetical protein
MSPFRIATSVQNTGYMAWMAMVFAYSCRRWYQEPPIIVVHAGDGKPLLPEFRLLREATGSPIVRTGDFEHVGPGSPYSPRNMPFALRAIDDVECEWLVVCDADFVFDRHVPFDHLALGADAMVMAESGFMRARDCPYLPFPHVCERTGLSYDDIINETGGAVPYILSNRHRVRFASEWATIMDYFAPPIGSMHWISIMWAAVLAAKRMNLAVILQPLCCGNSDRTLLQKGCPPIIHYGYNDSTFGKHTYFWPLERAREVWSVEPSGDGTTSDRVRREIADAARFYGLHLPHRRAALLS